MILTIYLLGALFCLCCIALATYQDKDIKAYLKEDPEGYIILSAILVLLSWIVPVGVLLYTIYDKVTRK